MTSPIKPFYAKSAQKFVTFDSDPFFDRDALDKIDRIATKSIYCLFAYMGFLLVTRSPFQRRHMVALCGASAYLLNKIVTPFIGHLIYPATLSSHCSKRNCTNDNHDQYHVNKDRVQEAIEILQKKQYRVEELFIEKFGFRYHAITIRHDRAIPNRKWTFHALGNLMTMERKIQEIAQSAIEERIEPQGSILLMNGPGVLRSEGKPTRYHFGACFEAGLQFLEKYCQATHIVMRGLSLGGGMLSEAILQHDFNYGTTQKIKYLFISDRSFGYISSTAASLVTRLAIPIFYLLRIELDAVSAARKLDKHGIRQIIIQHRSGDNKGSDLVIPDSVSLAHELFKQKITGPYKEFLLSPKIQHNGELPEEVLAPLNEKIQNFFQS